MPLGIRRSLRNQHRGSSRQLAAENPARSDRGARPDWLKAETEKPVGSASGLEIGLALGY